MGRAVRVVSAWAPDACRDPECLHARGDHWGHHVFRKKGCRICACVRYSSPREALKRKG